MSNPIQVPPLELHVFPDSLAQFAWLREHPLHRFYAGILWPKSTVGQVACLVEVHPDRESWRAAQEKADIFARTCQLAYRRDAARRDREKKQAVATLREDPRVTKVRQRQVRQLAADRVAEFAEKGRLVDTATPLNLKPVTPPRKEIERHPAPPVDVVPPRNTPEYWAYWNRKSAEAQDGANTPAEAKRNVDLWNARDRAQRKAEIAEDVL